MSDGPLLRLAEWDLAKALVGLIRRQCAYVTSSDSVVRQLMDDFRKLDDERHRVQDSTDEARNNMEEIEADVERWVKEAETVANKARDVLEYDERAKKTCLCRWLPNPKVRYCLSREAWRTIDDIRELIWQSQYGFSIESRAFILRRIINALDEEFTVIGIYGPGGVGKTMLLEKIQEKLRNEKRSFDLIATMTVSRTPDLKKFQDNIAYALGLDLKNEPSQVRRRDLLFSKLQSEPTKKVLIILDDLWAALDLNEVGIPLGDENKRCKLLLASRSKHVLERMHADRTFSVGSLNDNEALKLFEKTIGDRLKDDEELKAIAPQVVKKLGGLPLWIMPVASTLKYSGVSAWNNASINQDVDKIETIVKWIYDNLESEDAKSLFLLCGLIGGTIRVETLLVLGMGLGLFDGFNMTMHDSRDRLNTTLNSLRSIYLLQDGGNEKEDVTIHDLYSEVVVSTPFRDQNSLMMSSNSGSWTKEKLEKCWAICLVDAFGDRLADLMMCTFPNLKILMLCPPEDWVGDPAHRHDEGLLDFQYMKELRVLYLRSMHITTLPSSIEILVNLRSLHLDDCLVEDVTILGKLKALQILSIAGSAIYRLPKEIGDLMNLRSLNLSNCIKLRIIEPGVLESLINLEELHMKGSFDRLEILVRDPTILLEDGDLPFENLIRFCIHLGNVEGRTFEGLRTMELKWEDCDNVLSRGWVQKTLHETQYLHLDGLRESKKNAHELCTQGFGQLKHLDILKAPQSSTLPIHPKDSLVLLSQF